ncbi:hypothetical protein [Cerasicoccus maritimus]|uniref:arsenate reductase/protein-tyrosine-phosphatase family protein n=1 Tax=Cerasicoccus maritimus TaxID=490089 RepID=UPI002852C8ED|nr:hypothetical protein [Cerasicoccus maritimus]
MKKIRILFVCTYHGGRSKIAELFAHHHASDQVEAQSACFDPGTLGELPRGIMAEVGIELPAEGPASVFDLYKSGAPFDYVVTLCNQATTEQCPIFMTNVDVLYAKAAQVIPWSISDFQSLEGTPELRKKGARLIRDKIHFEVLALIKNIGVMRKSGCTTAATSVGTTI